jgi:hypothetical protein
MTLAKLIELFNARVIGSYTPAQYAQQVIVARANRMRWGMGQW